MRSAPIPNIAAVSAERTDAADVSTAPATDVSVFFTSRVWSALWYNITD